MKFDYKIVRSGRRTLCIEIKPDKQVLVRAPFSCSEKRIANFINEKSAWIEKHLLSIKEPMPEKLIGELEELKKRARELIIPRVRYYSEIMGLYPTSVKITSAKRRFGSCSQKNSLCFSLYLAEYPNEAIDYVVVHELAHIKHKNHSSDFHSLVRRYLPNEKELRKLLK